MEKESNKVANRESIDIRAERGVGRITDGESNRVVNGESIDIRAERGTSGRVNYCICRSKIKKSLRTLER